jgi:LPS-assembly protein
MLDLHRVLLTLALGLCLALSASAWQQDTPPPPATPPPAPEENPAQPAVPTPTKPVPDPTGGEPAPAQPAPAAPAPPTPSGPPGAGPDRLDFTLKTEDGGIATGSAGDLEYVREDYVRLVGGVQLKYQDVDIKAAQAELDLETQVVTAQGEVILDQGPRRLTGDTLNFNLETKTGTLTNATAHVAPDYYFEGREIVKTGEDTYQVTEGVFTSCNQEVPDWSFRLGTANVEVGGYARVRDASMRAKRLPVFYTPYILWPVKEDRTSGFLIPNIGYSDRRGASLGLAYYQVLGRSYDTTFHLDLYTQEYFGLGNELRYRPSEGTRGNLLGYVVRDPEIPLDEEWRWKLEWTHETTDLPWNMRGVVNYQEFSDFNFFQDFERDFDRNTLRFIDNRAFASGNWGPHLLNLLIQDRQTFITQDLTAPDSSIEQRKLPEVEYRLRSTRIGRTPLYAEFEGSAAYLDIFRPNSLEGQYGRFDLFPQLTLPIRTFPWLSLSVSGGGRFTWWGDTLTDTVGPDGQRVITNELDGETLSRTLPFASAQIVGPSFSRIYDAKIGGFGRFKHVIEPRWTYNYLGEFEEEDEIPSFDEVDNVGSNNRGRLALANRILGKPADGQGSAREIFLFEIARNYSFNDELPLQRGEGLTSQEGPLEALVRFTPTAGTSVKAEVDYNTLFRNLDSTSLSGNLGLGGGNAVGLTWFTNYNPVTGEAVNDQVRLSGSVAVWPDRLRFEGQINYDVEQGFLQQQTYVAYWTQQCYSLRLEWRDFQAGVDARIRDRDFRFSLSLKNVGTFLDLTSRSSTREP